MKKLFILLILAFTVLSCNDDDNNNNTGRPYEGSLTGTWKMVRLVDNGQEVDLSCEIEDPVFENYTFEFKDGGSLMIYSNCYPELLGEGLYTTQGDILKMAVDSEILTAHMVNYLSQDRLVFKFDVDSTEIFSGMEFTVEKQ